MPILAVLGRRTIALLIAAAVTVVVSLALVLSGAPPVVTFVATAIALGVLASLVGEGTDQLGARFSPAVTGILQSGLGNLPELFIAIFSLQAGLVVVVQSALIGSILANSLLVLGIAFLVGGLRHGTQRFEGPNVRSIAMLLLLAVAALVIPTLATEPGAPDVGHEADLSVIVSIVLLVVFAASVPYAVRHGGAAAGARGAAELDAGEQAWPLPLSIGVLTIAAVGAAFVADWFVEALRPAMAALGMSEAFAGLVVVAIAGNAVENVVGVTAAARDKAELAVSLILNSSLQIALALTPALVLLSMVMGGAQLTLVVTPLLAGAVAFSALLTLVIVFDGESNWLEGLALIGLYVIIAASVWWGPTIAV
jgi:Ca2+:H+ antiporter